MAVSLAMLLSRVQVPAYFYKWFMSGKFKNPVLLAITLSGITALMTREIIYNSFSAIASAYPTLTFWETTFLWLGTTHLRSFIFYAAMIFYLWWKWDRLLPALFTGWFGLGLIELTFIPQHFLATFGFFGLNWYAPFVGSMAAFLVVWLKDKSFKLLTDGFIVFFLAGVFVQYFLLLFRQYGFTIIVGDVVTINTAIFPHPPIQTWIWEFLNHLMKSLMTIAFCFVQFKGLPKRGVKA